MNPNEVNLQLCEILGIPKDAARATITIEPDSLPVVLIERHLIEADQVQHVEQRFTLTLAPEPKTEAVRLRQLTVPISVNVPWYAKAYLHLMARLARIGWLRVDPDRVQARLMRWIDVRVGDARVSVATPGGGSKV